MGDKERSGSGTGDPFPSLRLPRAYACVSAPEAGKKGGLMIPQRLWTWEKRLGSWSKYLAD